MFEIIMGIAFLLIATAALLFLIMLIIIFIGLPDIQPEGCDCGCENKPLDICSSECDDLCQKNNHYEGKEWQCHY